MLEFANHPPTSPDDASLSDTGKALLLDAKREDGIVTLAYGKVACSEVIDSFGSESEIDPLLAEALGDKIAEKGEIVLGHDTSHAHIFAKSMSDHMSNLVAIARTARMGA